MRFDTLDVGDPAWIKNLTDRDATGAPSLSGAKYRPSADAATSLKVNIIPDSQKVRVWVRRAASDLLRRDARRPFGHVQTMATAWANNAGPTVNCLKPFVMPDMWYESDKTTQDVNSNNYMEPADGHW